MLFTTTTQYVALAVALIAGWLFGLASHPGGRKWKTRYADERTAHAAARKDLDTRLAETRRDTDARLAEANARIKDLEAENSRLARTTPVAAPAAAPLLGTRAAPRATQAARPAGERRGWFDFGDRTTSRY